MAIKTIMKIPNPILTTKAERVKEINKNVKQVIQDLLDTLDSAKSPEGAGLAAPQIGVSKKICIVRRFIPDPNDRSNTLKKDHILINPKLISASTETDLHFEGCLSIPNTYGQVLRAKKIKVTALDENGNEVKYNATGFFARVMQHEMDHLEGILFTAKIVGKVMTEKELDALYDKEHINE